MSDADRKEWRQWQKETREQELINVCKKHLVQILNEHPNAILHSNEKPYCYYCGHDAVSGVWIWLIRRIDGVVEE